MHSPPSLPTCLVLGPTAAGKSSLAIELALRLRDEGSAGECISADSMQVYRGMDIGTAKTPLAERRGVPHHLVDLIEPDDSSFSVDRWLECCASAEKDIRSRGGTPIIVGGTNLYVQALLGGMSDHLPPPDQRLRDELNALPLDDLRTQLEAVDPQAAERIHFNDRKRTIRAIEVFQQTGKRLSEMQQQWSDVRRPPIAMDGRHERGGADMFVVGLDYPIEAINRRINSRVKAMIDAGLVEEVRHLLAAGRLGRNAREALGYKQVIDHLEGRCTLEDAIEQIKIRTRRYAKQQRTWLRRFRTYRPAVWLEASEASLESLAGQALGALLRCPTV